MEQRPKLRSNLIALPVEYAGRKMILFQDPERWCEELVFFPAEIAPIIQYFDGMHTLRDIQEKLMREIGELVMSDFIEKIARDLDSHLLLDSERFRNHIAQLKKEWSELKVRPPVLAGTSYPAEKEELKKFLDEFYTSPEGPGQVGENQSDKLRGIVAPHIELKDNGSVYARAYKSLYEQSQAEVFLILGTGHFQTEDLLVFCEKDFQTPLGIAETDRDFIQKVRAKMKKKSQLGDFSHRREHSVELQVIFLQHLLEGKREFKIVPALLGSFQIFLELGISPKDDPLFADYLNALKEVIAEYDKKLCIIASADLAHLGPRYGDRELYAPIREEEIKEDDQKMLNHLLQGDAEGFFQEIARIKDRRRICGLAPIYTSFKLLEPARAELLKWSVWYDMSTKSAVSFCSMAIY